MDNCLEQGVPDFVEEYGVVTVTFYKDKWNEENVKKQQRVHKGLATGSKD